MENQYNTLGITAMYEAVRDMGLIQEDAFGSNSYTDEGLDFATKILRTINEIKDSIKNLVKLLKKPKNIKFLNNHDHNSPVSFEFGPIDRLKNIRYVSFQN